MTTATEQGNASIEQDGGNKRGIGNASQAFNTALKTACTRSIGKKVEINISVNLIFFKKTSALWESIIASGQPCKSSPRLALEGINVKFLDYKPILQTRKCLLLLMASPSTPKPTEPSFQPRLLIIINLHTHAYHSILTL